MMKSAGSLIRAVKFLWHLFTGFGKPPEAVSEAGTATMAIFLPLVGLAAGFAAVAAVWVVRLSGLTLAPVVAGMAVLAVLGGWRQMKAAASILPEESRAAGIGVIAVLVILFETLAMYEASSYRDGSMLSGALLYLPVAGAVAMLSAASVTKAEESAPTQFSAVKGGHMLLGCALAFVLMLPRFGLLSLVFIAAAVLAGSVTALALHKRGGGEAAYIAALVAGLAYVLLLNLVERPIIYY